MRYSPETGIHSRVTQQREDGAWNELVARDEVRPAALAVSGSLVGLEMHSLKLQQMPRPFRVFKNPCRAAQPTVPEFGALRVLPLFLQLRILPSS